MKPICIFCGDRHDDWTASCWEHEIHIGPVCDDCIPRAFVELDRVCAIHERRENAKGARSRGSQGADGDDRLIKRARLVRR